MFVKEKKINLSELIDIKFLQEFQDVFAKTMNIASITLGNEGPITNPSNFTDFCIKYARNSLWDFERCNDCNIKEVKTASTKVEPVIYTCHLGLTNFAVPILLEGKRVGLMLGGQVLTESPNEDHFRRIAKELLINEDEYLEALRKIKIVPLENIKATANLLYFAANAISEIAYKNFELITKNEQESLIIKITEIIKSSSDLEYIKQEIINKIGILLNADRVFFANYDLETREYSVLSEQEYRSSGNIKSIVGVDFTKISGFDKYIKDRHIQGKNIIFNNLEQYLDDNNLKGTGVENYYREFDFISCASINISYENIFIGNIVITFGHQKAFSNDEINLLNTLASQIAIAIHQTKLYNDLKQNTKNQNAILNNMPFQAWLKNIEGKYLAVNQEFCNNYQLEKEDIIGKTDFDFSCRELAEKYILDDTEISKSGKQKITEEQIHSGKDTVWAETYKSPVFDYEGNIVGTVGMARDITERKESELELLRKQEQIIKINEREQLLRKIMFSSVSTFDIEIVVNLMVSEIGTMLKADRCFFIEYNTEKSNGLYSINSYAEYLSSQDIISHTIRPMEEADIETFIKLTKQKKITTVSNIHEIDLPKASKKMLIDDLLVKSYLVMPVYYGDIIYGALVLHYVNDFMQFTQDDINLVQAVASQSAIVIHQSQLYSTIEKNEKYTRTILNNIKDGIITINEDFTIESCNPSLESIWGYSLSEVIGKKIDLLLSLDFENTEKEDCLATVSCGIKKNGQEFPVEVDAREIDFDNRKVTLLVIKDITERKKIEKMKNEFISTVSHELRTPLTSIRGSLGLIISGVLGAIPEKALELANVANNNCIRLVNLINDILDIEKIKAGKMTFDIKEYEMLPIVQEAISLNESFAKQYNIKLNLKERIDSAYVNVDRDRIIQVITNLISNAVKYSHANNDVNIYLKQNNGNVLICVEDFGMGIPEEFHSEIFQSFSQADSSDTRAKGGTGLGLAICKEIVKNFKGKIYFHSKKGIGTNFCVELPQIIRQTPYIKQALICEDSKTSATYLKLLLEKLNYNVDIAYSIEQTKELLFQKHYELITIDLILPDGNGMDLLKEIRETKQYKDLPVIVISASDIKKTEKINEYKIAQWIDKSFNYEDLKSIINDLLKEKKQSKFNILHVDDDQDILDVTELTLKNIANITKSKDIFESNEIIDKKTFDLIILDYKLPDGNCNELVDKILTSRNKNAKTIIFSAYEIEEELSQKVDMVFLKTIISSEKLAESVKELLI